VRIPRKQQKKPTHRALRTPKKHKPTPPAPPPLVGALVVYALRVGRVRKISSGRVAKQTGNKAVVVFENGGQKKLDIRSVRFSEALAAAALKAKGGRGWHKEAPDF